jgi:hypothetical protein
MEAVGRGLGGYFFGTEDREPPLLWGRRSVRACASSLAMAGRGCAAGSACLSAPIGCRLRYPSILCGMTPSGRRGGLAGVCRCEVLPWLRRQCCGWRETNGAGVGTRLLHPPGQGEEEEEGRTAEGVVGRGGRGNRACMVNGRFFLVLQVRLPAKAILVVDGSVYGRGALVGGVDGAALTYLPGILLGKPSIRSSGWC